MPTITDRLCWNHVKGRDREGESFDVHLAVHGSGRILAGVNVPQAEEAWSRVYFNVQVTQPDE